MADKKKGNKPLSDDEIVKRISKAVGDAVGFSSDNIALKQERGLELYNRELFDSDKPKDGGKDPLKGRSKFVSPDVQERVDWFTAQEVRVMDSQSKVVEFTPNGPEDAPIAQQMNTVLNYIIRNQNSHATMLTPWLKNGNITGLGVVNIDFYQDKGWTVAQTRKGVPEEALVELVAKEEAGDAKIISRSEPYPAPLPPELTQQGMTPEALAALGMPLPMLRDIKVRERKNTWKMRITNVKPEDFFVSKDADFDQQTGGIKARLQGHKCVLARATLIEMGFDEEKVALATSASDSSTGIAAERAKQTDHDQGVGQVEDDVDVYEVYTRMDIDGDGWREHVHLTIAGDLQSAPVLLRVEEVSEYYPYAAYCPFPLPNTLFGHGIADKIGDDQRLISNIIRGNVDGLNQSINPQKVVNMQAIPNFDDLLNPHPGKIIRSDGDPSAAVSFVNTPYNGGPSMQFIDVLKQNMDNITGVGGAMMAVNSTDFQSTSAVGLSQRANSMQLLTELSIRFFADTGYRYMFRVMVDLLRNNPEGAEELITRLTGSYAPISVDQWDPDLDINTTVAFGIMNRDYNQAMLEKILGLQREAITAGSPLANETNVYNTVMQMLENAGFKNATAYVNDPAKTPPQPKQEQPDPMQVQAQIAQADIESRAKAAEENNQLRLLEMYMKDDRERDKQDQELALRTAEIIGKYATPVDIPRVDQMVSTPRDNLAAGFAQIAAMERQVPQPQPNPGPQTPPMMPPQMPQQ